MTPPQSFIAVTSLRSQDHDHLAAFETGLALDLRDGLGIGFDTLQNGHAELRVRHLAAPEAKRNLDLVTLFEESLYGAHLHVVVVIINAGTHFDLFQLDDFLVLSSLGSFLLFLEFELAEIKDLADRRLRVGRDLNEIQSGLFGTGKGIEFCNNADILTGLINETDFPGPDLIVDAGP
jgi:hypothetical protein